MRKFCGKFAEKSRKFSDEFCNDPFPNDQISELLILPCISESIHPTTLDALHRDEELGCAKFPVAACSK